MSNNCKCDIKISDDVVASIAVLAACEVEGISSMAGNITNEAVKKHGLKNSSKGIKLKIEDGIVTADMYVNIKFGYSIPKITEVLQDRVSSAIESMTGLKTGAITIHIVGIDIK